MRFSLSSLAMAERVTTLLRQHVLADGLDGESVAGRNGTAAKVLLRGAGCRQEHGGHRQEIIKYLFHLYAVFGCCFIG